jgi:hypothetical protein
MSQLIHWAWRVERARLRGLLIRLVDRWRTKYPPSRGSVGPAIQPALPTVLEPDGVPEADGERGEGHGIPGYQDRPCLTLRMRYTEVRPRRMGSQTKWVRTWGREYTHAKPPSISALLGIQRRDTSDEGGAMRSIYRRPEEPTDDRPLVTDYQRDFLLLRCLYRYYTDLGIAGRDFQSAIEGLATRLRTPHDGVTLTTLVQDYEYTALAGDILRTGTIRGFLAPYVRAPGRGRPRRSIPND